MSLAVPLHAYLHVTHVVDLDDFPIEPDRDDWERRIVDTVERERTEACTMLASLPGNWSYYCHEGNPAHLLATIADANDALMIIIGSSRGGLVSVLERERTEACTMLASLPGNWSYYCHEGNPAHLLATIADANDALMIIIGSSRGGLVSVLERVVGESVSSHLVHHGLGPVVLVPEHASAPRDRRPGAE